MKKNQQQSPSFNNLISNTTPQVREESEEFDADYEVIESSILISCFSEWYAQQAQQTMRESDFDLHLAVCEMEMKNGIHASLDPIPLSEPPPPDATIYNLNAILDGLI